jgi:cytochrome c oxidase assembly factor CtaG
MDGNPWVTPGRLLAFLLILTAGIVFVRGWRLLYMGQYSFSLPEGRPPATIRSLLAFWAGLALLTAAVVFPVGYLATQYFSMRVVQHLWLIASVPSLLLLSNPLPILWAGLPERVRGYGEEVQISAEWRERLRRATHPAITIIAFISICWFWYDPVFHQATLTYGWVHTLEIITLFVVALLNWWHVIGAAPHVHPPMHWVVRVLYTLISVWPVKLVGLILLFSGEQFYYYPASFQFSGLQINDYSLGAMIAWVIGGTVYAVTCVLLIRRWLISEEEKPALPESAWAMGEAMLAPGRKP